jgi:putative nucleotidyltransferase with HDIG domain
MRWLYRSTQFFSALLGRVSERDMEEARQVLGTELYKAFAAMPSQYRSHMLAVYRRVRDAGCGEPYVWQAALLHDTGKYDPASGRYVTLPYRVGIVLLAATPPGRRLLAKLSKATTQKGWRYPFYLNHHHARLGAQRAAQQGASQEVVGLIANHHNHKSQGQGLKALQAADERS